MNTDFRDSRSQFEFFPKSQTTIQNQARPRYLLKDFTLSLENAIVASIMMVMAAVVFFSFGVEHGKQVSQYAAAPQEIKLDVHKKNDILSPSSNPKNTIFAIPMTTAPKAGSSTVVDEIPAANKPIIEVKPDISQPYTIQVASFKQQKYAKQEASLLEKIGYEAYVLLKGSHSIVCVGKFSNKNEAERISKKLKQKYNDCLVRRF